MNNFGGKGAAIVLVILIMGGSLALFFMMQVMNQINPDVHEESHDYSVVGVLYEEDCTGTGKTEYAPESAKAYVYSFELKISSKSHSETIKMPLIFNTDDKMEDMFHYVGEETIGDVTVSVYTQENQEGFCTFYIGEKCKMIRCTIVSDDYSITADIVESA
jgi:hypothetical protein